MFPKLWKFLWQISYAIEKAALKTRIQPGRKAELCIDNASWIYWFWLVCIPSTGQDGSCTGICWAEKGPKEKRHVPLWMHKSRLNSSCDLVSMYNILFSAMCSSAEDLVTCWALVWWCVESKEQDIFLVRWGFSVRKREDHEGMCTQWSHESACFLYSAYPVSTKHWTNVPLSVENCSLLLWLSFPPPPQDFMGLLQCSYL